jgi:hypothetical protein
MRLNQDVDHVAVWIHGTPEILLLAVNSNENLVQVPHIAEATLTPLQFSGIVGTELLTPQPDRFFRKYPRWIFRGPMFSIADGFVS